MVTRLLSWLELWRDVVSAEVTIGFLLRAEVVFVRIKHLGSMVVAGMVRIWFFEVFLHWFMILVVLDGVGLVFSMVLLCMMITLFIVIVHFGLVLS